MVDYLAGIPETGCYPVVPISDSDMAYLYATFQKLNAMVKRAAAAGGAEFVDTYTPSIGHHVCSPPNHRYVEGLGVVSVNGAAVAVPGAPELGRRGLAVPLDARGGAGGASPSPSLVASALSSRARAPSRARWQTLASSSPCSHSASDSARLVPPCSRVRTTSISWSRASS